MCIDMPKLKEGESYNYKHVKEWLDSVMFGQSNLQQDFTIFGKTFSANEAVGTLNAFTAISTLSFNLLQGANQSILDNLMMMQESVAGQFLDKGDLAWAKGEYWGSGMAVTDIGRFDPKSKIGKAVEFFDKIKFVFFSNQLKKILSLMIECFKISANPQIISFWGRVFIKDVSLITNFG